MGDVGVKPPQAPPVIQTLGLGPFKPRTFRARRGEEMQLDSSCRPAPPKDCTVIMKTSRVGLSRQGVR